MASVATFEGTTDIIDIVYELDDREIHNDIRSETRVSETETVIDSEDEYIWSFIYMNIIGSVAPGDCFSKTFHPSHDAVEWTLGEYECYSMPDYNDYAEYTLTIESSSATHITLRLCNTGGTDCRVDGYIHYKYLSSAGTSHDETVWSTLTVRVTDPISIKKYARRVLNLTWPLGATQVQTQSIAESYRDKYSEPVSRITMWIKGKTDALKVQILTRKISDLITVISSQLGLNTDYYINRIDYKDFTDRLPQVVWTLEEQRASELAGIFLIDTSELDGPAWIG